MGFFALFSDTCFTYLYFVWVIALFRMAPKHSTEVLSSLPKSKKAGMCLMEKRHALDKLSSGMSRSAVDCGFNANESTTSIK